MYSVGTERVIGGRAETENFGETSQSSPSEAVCSDLCFVTHQLPMQSFFVLGYFRRLHFHDYFRCTAQLRCRFTLGLENGGRFLPSFAPVATQCSTCNRKRLQSLQRSDRLVSEDYTEVRGTASTSARSTQRIIVRLVMLKLFCVVCNAPPFFERRFAEKHFMTVHVHAH